MCDGHDDGASIDDLLDRAVAAINRGDRAAATALAGQVLAVDGSNTEAEDLLADDLFEVSGDAGEIRRLTILFADLVDSTALSTMVEPETYRLLVGRYREHVLRIVDRLEGHVCSTKGDGLLAVFGYPRAHEDDARRAVAAGLEITQQVGRLSAAAQRRFGVEFQVRVGVHRGLVYLDTAQDDVYGLAANLAARVSGLAPPGSVVVSDAVAPLIDKVFELRSRPPAAVKGVAAPVTHHQVIGERAEQVRVARGILVGRERELARLQKSWARAQAGTLTTPGVVFRGEPGIGKSRLAAAATEMVEGSGRMVLELVGSPFHIDVGLHPVRSFIERRCGIDRSTDASNRLRLLVNEIDALPLDSETTVPLLAPVLAIAPEVGYQPVLAEGRKLQELIASGVDEYLRACLGEGAALVVAEDVHWFDSSSLDVLGALLHANPGRLMVVVTGRSGGWLREDWPLKVFDLAPLTDAQTDELIVALNPAVSVEQRAAVRERCDGMPFYIEQVVAGLEQSGGEDSTVPEALYEPLFARLRASANVVPVVEAAAAIGRHVDRPLLIAVSGLGADELDDAIDELEDARVLEPCGAERWRFRHELLREVASELTPPSVRRDLHARVAGALIASARWGEPDWRVIAGHHEHAEQFTQAASAFQQAAADARRRGALAEARSDLTHALFELDRAVPGPDRDRREMGLRLERGILAGTVDGYQRPAAATDFERCLQLLEVSPRDNELEPMLLAMLSYHFVRADLNRLSQLLEMLRAGLDDHRPWLQVLIEGASAAVAFYRGDLTASLAHLNVVDTALSAMGERQIDATAFLGVDRFVSMFEVWGEINLLRGDLAGAEAMWGKAIRRTEELSSAHRPYNRGFVGIFGVWMFIELGQLDRAAALAVEAIELAEMHGLDTVRLTVATQQAAVSALALLDGDPVDQSAVLARISTLGKLLDTWRRIGLESARPILDAIVGRLFVATGRNDEARQWLDAALKVTADNGMRFYDAELLRIRAHAQRDPDARQADLTAAIELSRSQGALLLELRAALDEFELCGDSARSGLIDAASRIPADSQLPELARARAVIG